MLKNYIKIAFRVMMRQKFFTAVSIFGISFTIMIFSIAAGMTDLIFGNVPPAVNRDRTIYFEGAVIYDKNDKAQAQGPNNDKTFFNQVKQLPGVERLCKYRLGKISTYQNDKKVTLNIAFTDEELWNIYDFQFLEGKPFTSADIAGRQSVAVITEAVKKHYFGEGPALGKYIESTPNIRVIGVVKDFVSVYAPGTESSDVFIPLTRLSASIKSESGAFEAIILARKKTEMPLIKSALLQLINKKYNAAGNKDVYLRADNIYDKIDFEEFIAFMGGFLFFIMVIPAMNIMGLNINRIAERSSEIGIRKAFGASSRVLVGQFLTENLIITFMGAMIGILLTVVASGLVINLVYRNAAIVPSGNFLINGTVIGYALLASVFFGFLSGVLPAWRMSRLHTVKALKGGNL